MDLALNNLHLAGPCHRGLTTMWRGCKLFTEPRVMPAPSLFPTNLLYTTVDSTPLDYLPIV